MQRILEVIKDDGSINHYEDFYKIIWVSICGYHKQKDYSTEKPSIEYVWRMSALEVDDNKYLITS
jgi:hypothetical protein